MNILKLFQSNKKNIGQGLQKTKTVLFQKLSNVLFGKSIIEESMLDTLEESLITADIGIDTTAYIMDNIQRIVKKKTLHPNELYQVLKKEIEKLLTNTTPQDFLLTTDIPKNPYVILVVGINGVGKTTTIGKLAAQLTQHNQKVILAAADTFRAAAVDQLKLWGEKIGVPVVEKGMRADPSSVAYEAVKQGIEQKANYVIIDTAGRLHTKINLMNELAKIRRTISKLLPHAPHEVLLIIDGSTGQNALIQAQQFAKITNVNALAITKLDGSAKGGIVIGIAHQLHIPVKYIGIGEGINDLQLFDKKIFIDSLFEDVVP